MPTHPAPPDLSSAADWPPGRVLVIAATLNERDNLARLSGGILAVDPQLQLLIVDDDSPDGTGTAALEAAKADPRLHVLVRRGRRGLGTAIMEGLRLARTKGFAVAVNIDADASHDPADIPRLLAALDPVAGPPADVVVGSRRVPGGGLSGGRWPATSPAVWSGCSPAASSACPSAIPRAAFGRSGWHSSIGSARRRPRATPSTRSSSGLSLGRAGGSRRCP
jgi:glycosyltransferase involved in cell wall biosynthesis